MCGIAGQLHFDPARPVAEDAVRRMTAVLRHRGPDDEGVWVDGAVGLGSRRLAIIDLSPRARQPLANEDGTVRVVFNGEIYNHRELRRGLEARGHRFRSSSDTETLVHLWEDHGVGSLAHLRGMFAFALWDARTRTLCLARDRLGKKPLYYRLDADGIDFGSEAKAVLQCPDAAIEPAPEALLAYLARGYVPGPGSAFRGLARVPPAHYLLVSDGRVALERYWTLAWGPKRAEPEETLREELGALLGEAVRLRLESDVPLGALLSGGLDSSTVVALMRRAATGPLRTFSIGFGHQEYDELGFARQVAERFETEHHELVVEPDAVAALPRLVWHYDEPFADASALPSMAVAGLARGEVTVALNGDGGDEAFLGYDRYGAAGLAARLDALPAGLRRAGGWLARGLPRRGPKSAFTRARRFAEAAALPPGRRYGRWMAIFDDRQLDALCAPEFRARADDGAAGRALEGAWEASAAAAPAEVAASVDLATYLPDDLLVKMDIASMAHSLEVRSPFLDHRVMEFAARLPVGLKRRPGAGKHLVRALMAGVLPADVLRRPKMGFGVPLDHWFRGPLVPHARDVLLDRRTEARGYFRPGAVSRLLDEHAAGRADHHARLWSLLVLELWHRTYVDAPPAGAPPVGA